MKWIWKGHINKEERKILPNLENSIIQIIKGKDEFSQICYTSRSKLLINKIL